MVFMQRRNDGHPLAALLLLFSMFAFAFVFHVVTRPEAPVAAHLDRQLAAFARPVAPDVPTLGEPRQPAAAASPVTSVVEPAPPVEASALATDSHPPALTLPPPITIVPSATVVRPVTVVPLPAAAVSATLQPSAPDGGAVTRAFTTTGSALRSAFRKAF